MMWTLTLFCMPYAFPVDARVIMSAQAIYLKRFETIFSVIMLREAMFGNKTQGQLK